MRPFLSESELRQRAHALRELQSPCQLCPRRCGVLRACDQFGFCRQPQALQVAIACLHRGEEPPIVGEKGAGTVFLCGCTLRCAFCQNYQISHDPPRIAHAISASELAATFLDLERRGAHTLEWVSPTQHLPGLVEALALARAHGLSLPLVYNSGGYEREEILALLDGIVDVYLPDAKYAQRGLAEQLSLAPDYPAINARAISVMHAQVGLLQASDENGGGLTDSLGQNSRLRGLIIRHLVLPGALENTRAVFAMIAATVGRDAAVSVMAQYTPTDRLAELLAGRHHPRDRSSHVQLMAAQTSVGGGPAIRRRLTRREYLRVLHLLDHAGLESGWVQERGTDGDFLPDFNLPDPFGAKRGHRGLSVDIRAKSEP